MRRVLLALLLIVGTSVPLAAQQTEVHAVGVYEGNEKTDGRIHGPEAHVLVDRANVPVILSLSSYDALRWFVETAPGSRIETILLHGYEAERTEVYLNGVQVTPQILTDARYNYQVKGQNFRALLKRLEEETGISGLASFHGAYSAPAQPFVINSIQKNPDNRINRLADFVRPDVVPETLRKFLDPAFVPDTPAVRFTYDGFQTTLNGEMVTYAPSLDVPSISHPTGATIDLAGERLFGVTFGGEGFIYQYDIAADQWSVLNSMQGMDAVSMLYDPSRDRLIMGMGVVSSGLAIYDIASGRFRDVALDTKVLPGFSDLYDPGNGPRAALYPVAIDGDMLLASGGPDGVFRRMGEGSTPTRTYLIDLVRGEATLVAYSN